MISVKLIMEKKVPVVKAKTSLEDIAKILTKNKMTGIPVVDSKRKIIGFVSERDITAAVAKGLSGCAKKCAKDIMTKKVIAVNESDPVEKISKIFTSHPFRCLPVTKDQKIVGIISRKNVINRLLGQYY